MRKTRAHLHLQSLEQHAPLWVTTMERVVLSWSGGKDSAMALFELRRSGDYEVVALLTTVASEFERVSHHGVRVELLEQQAAAVGVALHKLYLPRDRCTNEEYEALMERTMLDFCANGIRTVAFGDIFLADLRAYRERNLGKVGMRGLFPLWHRDTAELLRAFISLGFRAHLACVEGTKLGREFAGRAIDATLLHDLPPEVDPCGENGEFHSFVYDGPIFRRPIRVTVGEVVSRDSRYFAELLPADSPGNRKPLGE
jgi:uncharacterized protein (TIGR00290 family)